MGKKSQTLNAILHRQERQRISTQIERLKTLGFIANEPTILKAPRTSNALNKIQDIDIEELAKSGKYIDKRSGETFTGEQGVAILKFRGELDELYKLEFDNIDTEKLQKIEIDENELVIRNLTNTLEDYTNDKTFLWNIKEPALYNILTVLQQGDYDKNILLTNESQIAELLSQLYYASKSEDIYIPEARILSLLGVDTTFTDELILKADLS